MSKTYFKYLNDTLRISKDESGNDRFTEEEIIKYIEEEQVIREGTKGRLICRASDGAVLAEVQEEDPCSKCYHGYKDSYSKPCNSCTGKWEPTHFFPKWKGRLITAIASAIVIGTLAFIFVASCN